MSTIGGRAVADLLAVVEHRRLVLLPLADHDDAVHRDRVEDEAHRVDRGLVGGDLVAAADPAGGGQGGGLGDAHELEREVAVGLGGWGGLHLRNPIETIRVAHGPLGTDAAAAGTDAAPITSELVKRAEAAGYTDLWTGETAGPDGFTPLALSAAWTERARLGTGIVGVFQRGPALLAQEAAALADASRGASCSASAPPRTGSSKAGTGSPSRSR